MTEEDIQRVEDAFVQAVERCKQVGCKSLFSPIVFNCQQLTCLLPPLSRLHRDSWRARLSPARICLSPLQCAHGPIRRLAREPAALAAPSRAKGPGRLGQAALLPHQRDRLGRRPRAGRNRGVEAMGYRAEQDLRRTAPEARRRPHRLQQWRELGQAEDCRRPGVPGKSRLPAPLGFSLGPE